MKTKAILVSALALITISAEAQKGSWYLGGNAGFSSTQNKRENGTTTTDVGKTTSWSFSPEFGTFLTNHVQVGLGLTLSGSKIDNQAAMPGIGREKNYGATLYSRYFFGKEAFKPFVGVNIAAAPGKSKFTQGNNTTESETFSFGANINAGFGYAISKRFTAIGSFGFLGYNYNTSKIVGINIKNKTSTFGLDAGSLGQRFNVGFYYTICQ
jgi:Outer membrane protein beta-barrel domain